MAKSWAEKLNGAKPAHVSVLDKPFGGLAKGEKVFIATPIMVRDYMKKIRKGRTKTIVEMREEFARAAKADGTCAMTASIFARIAAEAALDDMASGAPPEKITPFWRLIDPRSPLAKKLSCGPAFIEKMRKAEASV